MRGVCAGRRLRHGWLGVKREHHGSHPACGLCVNLPTPCKYRAGHPFQVNMNSRASHGQHETHGHSEFGSYSVNEKSSMSAPGSRRLPALRPP